MSKEADYNSPSKRQKDTEAETKGPNNGYSQSPMNMHIEIGNTSEQHSAPADEQRERDITPNKALDMFSPVQPLTAKCYESVDNMVENPILEVATPEKQTTEMPINS